MIPDRFWKETFSSSYDVISPIFRRVLDAGRGEHFVARAKGHWISGAHGRPQEE